MKKPQPAKKVAAAPPSKPNGVPKKFAPGELKCGDMVFYLGDRYWVEIAPDTWEVDHYVRVSSHRIRPDQPPYPKRFSFMVHADKLDKVRTVPTERSILAGRLPTPASEARAERARTGGSASRDVGDEIAAMLRDADFYKAGAKYLGVPEAELRAKYEHLNPGQQRMNVGNRMRAKWKKEHRGTVCP